MKNLIKDYFYFTKRERNGLLLLVGLALLFLALPTIFRKFRSVEKYEFQEYKQLMASTIERDKNQTKTSKESMEIVKFDPKPIDPNLADKQAFLNLGLSQKLVNTILNYRNKGGKFKDAKSLKKIYGMTESDFQRIQSYLFFLSTPEITARNNPKAIVVSQLLTSAAQVVIQPPTQKFDPNTISKKDLQAIGLPEKIINRMIKFRNNGGKFQKAEELKVVYGMKEAWVEKLLPWMEIVKPMEIDPEKINLQKKKVKKKENPITDINQATFEDWQNLFGIGPYYADKIMGYREKLGGFVSVDQLKETNGLPDSILQSILPALRTSEIFRKIKINKTSTKEMAMHPYITWKQANAIQKYRNQHGPFNTISDLENMLALNPEFISRIFPYIDFTKPEK